MRQNRINMRYISVFIGTFIIIAFIITMLLSSCNWEKYINEDANQETPISSEFESDSVASSESETGDNTSRNESSESSDDTSGTETCEAPENNIMFQSSEANFAFVYPHDDLTLSSYSNWEGEYGNLSLNVSITALENMERDARDAAVSEKEALENGDFGQDIDFSFEPSRKIISIGDVFVKEYMVLEGYDICDTTFERSTIFYNNDCQVQITLLAGSDEIMEGIEQYFTNDDINCPEEKVWTPDGKTGFYDRLVSGEAAPVAQKWYEAFNDIMYLLQINDFKGASAGYSRLIDERYFEENVEEKYIIDIAYPRFQSAYTGGLDDSINKTVYDDTIVPMIDDFKEEVSSYDYEDENLNYFLSVDYQVVAFDENIIALCLDIYPYMGGAHGMLYFETFNFDIGKNRIIGLEDLFEPGYDYGGVISEYCRTDLIEQMQERGFEPDGEWVEDGTDPHNADNFTNFLITPYGLIIKFPAYQVAPYAAGDFSVTIPYGQLEGFIGPYK